MMLHQDGSRHAWLAGQPALDLIVTMDDATSAVYSAFLVEEEGTASSLRACLEVFGCHGLPCALYTDRGSHYFYTPAAGGRVDKTRLTQVGRALDRLGIEHIPAYSPEARGRSERMFGTLQDRLGKELALSGIADIDTANRWIRQVYLPEHNRLFARPALLGESAFVAVDGSVLVETLAIEEERVVARDNTVAWGRLQLQLPASPLRAHYVRARVKVRQYPDGGLAVLLGPRPIGRYDASGRLLPPSPPSLAPGSQPSRPGLRRPCGPALTAPAPDAARELRVGTRKRVAKGSNQGTGRPEPPLPP